MTQSEAVAKALAENKVQHELVAQVITWKDSGGGLDENVSNVALFVNARGHGLWVNRSSLPGGRQDGSMVTFSKTTSDQQAPKPRPLKRQAQRSMSKLPCLTALIMTFCSRPFTAETKAVEGIVSKAEEKNDWNSRMLQHLSE